MQELCKLQSQLLKFGRRRVLFILMKKNSGIIISLSVMVLLTFPLSVVNANDEEVTDLYFVIGIIFSGINGTQGINACPWIFAENNKTVQSPNEEFREYFSNELSTFLNQYPLTSLIIKYTSTYNLFSRCTQGDPFHSSYVNEENATKIIFDPFYAFIGVSMLGESNRTIIIEIEMFLKEQWFIEKLKIEDNSDDTEALVRFTWIEILILSLFFLKIMKGVKQKIIR